MEPEPVLVDELAILTAALDDPALDIAAGIEQLERRVRAAVHGYAGLTVIVGGATPTVVHTRVAEDAPLRTSLHLTLPRSARASPPVVPVLHGVVAGAFVDLAADVAWLAGRFGAAVVLDEHLTVTRPDPARSVRAASTVDQAVGVLIGRGLVPADAVRELDARAARDGLDRLGAAERLLASLDDDRDDDEDRPGPN